MATQLTIGDQTRQVSAAQPRSINLDEQLQLQQRCKRVSPGLAANITGQLIPARKFIICHLPSTEFLLECFKIVMQNPVRFQPRNCTGPTEVSLLRVVLLVYHNGRSLLVSRTNYYSFHIYYYLSYYFRMFKHECKLHHSAP